MFKVFESHIDREFPFLKDKRLLIAISGGVDSVVLAHLCHKMALNFSLAHCNFNLRGAESDGDEALVIRLAEAFNVEAFVQHFDTKAFAKAEKLSIQMAARTLRYDWFNELAAQLQYDYILTAHHADDNLETFLINFLRGTGLNGLTGIPEHQDQMVRPLLSFSRAEIQQFVQAEHIEWREDLSNSSRKYLRNKLRHDVVPILKTINPELLSTFQQTLSNLKDTSDIVKESLRAVRKRAVVNQTETEIVYKISEFKKVNNAKAYMFEMFKSYGFSEWDDVVGLLNAQSGKQVLSKTHRLVKHRAYLILSKRHAHTSICISIADSETQVSTNTMDLYFETVSQLEDPTVNVIYVDKALLTFPLTIRTRQKGDLFYPFGMKGKKKLSKYFKDEKYSLLDKENALLLCSKDQIVWVIGKRADNRYRVTPDTKQILKIRYEDKR